MDINIKHYFPGLTVGLYDKEVIIDFLYEHLDEYGDEKADISKCVDYALNAGSHPGGLIISAWDGDQIIGATVINKTGMSGYIPENILVYIATHAGYRGKGVGKAIIDEVFKQTQGDIALHVEHENPAKKLYEKLGFENKYLEMRWKRK